MSRFFDDKTVSAFRCRRNVNHLRMQHFLNSTMFSGFFKHFEFRFSLCSLCLCGENENHLYGQSSRSQPPSGINASGLPQTLHAERVGGCSKSSSVSPVKLISPVI